jgi:transposase-like protein
MKRSAFQIKTLQDAVVYFSDPDNALDYMANKRWPDGVECPTCGRKDVVFLKTQRKWQCKSVHPKRQFTAKVGTVLEDSPIPLEKWLPVMWMLSNCRNGVSSCEIARTIGITQKSAWFMLHRIRLAMQSGSLMKLGGSGTPVQVDETFIGGKARFMHKAKRAKLDKMASGNKTIVAGLLESDGKVVTKVIEDRNKPTLHRLINDHVQPGSQVTTDDYLGYWGLYENYIHQIVDHMETYVDGKYIPTASKTFGRS